MFTVKRLMQEHLGAEKDIEFVSCSDKVGRVLGADVMKSVKHLIPDLLANYPVLLYQGKRRRASLVVCSQVFWQPQIGGRTDGR